MTTPVPGPALKPSSVPPPLPPTAALLLPPSPPPFQGFLFGNAVVSNKFWGNLQTIIAAAGGGPSLSALGHFGNNCSAKQEALEWGRGWRQQRGGGRGQRPGHGARLEGGRRQGHGHFSFRAPRYRLVRLWKGARVSACVKSKGVSVFRAFEYVKNFSNLEKQSVDISFI